MCTYARKPVIIPSCPGLRRASCFAAPGQARINTAKSLRQKRPCTEACADAALCLGEAVECLSLLGRPLEKPFSPQRARACEGCGIFSPCGISCQHWLKERVRKVRKISIESCKLVRPEACVLRDDFKQSRAVSVMAPMAFQKQVQKRIIGRITRMLECFSAASVTWHWRGAFQGCLWLVLQCSFQFKLPPATLCCRLTQTVANFNRKCFCEETYAQNTAAQHLLRSHSARRRRHTKLQLRKAQCTVTRSNSQDLLAERERERQISGKVGNGADMSAACRCKTARANTSCKPFFFLGSAKGTRLAALVFKARRKTFFTCRGCLSPSNLGLGNWQSKLAIVLRWGFENFWLN